MGDYTPPQSNPHGGPGCSASNDCWNQSETDRTYKTRGNLYYKNNFYGYTARQFKSSINNIEQALVNQDSQIYKLFALTDRGLYYIDENDKLQRISIILPNIKLNLISFNDRNELIDSNGARYTLERDKDNNFYFKKSIVDNEGNRVSRISSYNSKIQYNTVKFPTYSMTCNLISNGNTSAYLYENYDGDRTWQLNFNNNISLVYQNPQCSNTIYGITKDYAKLGIVYYFNFSTRTWNELTLYSNSEPITNLIKYYCVYKYTATLNEEESVTKYLHVAFCDNKIYYCFSNSELITNKDNFIECLKYQKLNNNSSFDQYNIDSNIIFSDIKNLDNEVYLSSNKGIYYINDDTISYDIREEEVIETITEEVDGETIEREVTKIVQVLDWKFFISRMKMSVSNKEIENIDKLIINNNDIYAVEKIIVNGNVEEILIKSDQEVTKKSKIYVSFKAKTKKDIYGNDNTLNSAYFYKYNDGRGSYSVTEKVKCDIYQIIRKFEDRNNLFKISKYSQNHYFVSDTNIKYNISYKNESTLNYYLRRVVSIGYSTSSSSTKLYPLCQYAYTDSSSFNPDHYDPTDENDPYNDPTNPDKITIFPLVGQTFEEKVNLYKTDESVSKYTTSKHELYIGRRLVSQKIVDEDYNSKYTINDICDIENTKRIVTSSGIYSYKNNTLYDDIMFDITGNTSFREMYELEYEAGDHPGRWFVFTTSDGLLNCKAGDPSDPSWEPDWHIFRHGTSFYKIRFSGNSSIIDDETDRKQGVSIEKNFTVKYPSYV